MMASGRRPGQRAPQSPDAGGTFKVTPRPPIIKSIVPKAAPTHRTAMDPRKITLQGTAWDQIRDILFGRCQQGLKLIYADSFFSGTIVYLAAGISEGPVHSITPILDDVPMVDTGLGYWMGKRYNSSGTLVDYPYVTAWIFKGAIGYQDSVSGLTGYDPGWITTGEDFDNLAYVVFRIVFNINDNTSIPTIKFDVEGYADILDVRTGLRGYTDNDALIIREVMSNTRWGFKIPSSYLDDPTFMEAADDCDALVFPAKPTAAPTLSLGSAGNPPGLYYYVHTSVNASGVETLISPYAGPISALGNKVNVGLPAADSVTASRNVYRSADNGTPDPSSAIWRLVGNLPGNGAGTFVDNVDDAVWATGKLAPTIAPYTSKRYSFNMGISRQASGADWFNTLLAHCVGVITYDNGKYQLRLNKALPPGYTRKEYSTRALAGMPANVDPESIQLDRAQRADLFDEVEIKFTDIQNAFAPGNVVITRPGAVFPRRAVYELGGLPDSSMAGNVGTKLLNLSADDATFEFVADRSGLESVPWDVIHLTGDGLVQQDVRLRNVKADGEGTRLSGTEYREDSFADVLVPDYAPLSAGISRLDPAFKSPPDVSAPDLSVFIFDGGAYGSLTFTLPAFAFFEAVEVYLSVDTGSGPGPTLKWFDATSSPAKTPPLVEIGDYTITLRVRSRTKQLSPGVSFVKTIASTSSATSADGVGLFLTNEAYTAAAASDGSAPDLSGANGFVEVVSGATHESSSATIGTPTATGCTGTVNTDVDTPVVGQPKGYYQVTAMAADTATFNIPVTYGTITATLRFSLAKSKQGGVGLGKTLTVICDRQTVNYDGTGAISPSSQTTTFRAVKQNVTSTVTWTLTRLDGTVLDPSLYLSSTTGDTVTMTAANFDLARGSTNGVTVGAYADEDI